MEAGKGAGKAFRGIVAVFQGEIDDFCAAPGQLLAGEREAAHTDIIAQREAAQDAEDPLEMEGGRIGLFGHRFQIELFGEVGFHIVDRLLDTGNPIHHGTPFLPVQFTRSAGRFPDFFCFLLSGHKDQRAFFRSTRSPQKGTPSAKRRLF